MNLPMQSPPVTRNLLVVQGRLNTTGLNPSETDVCGDLTGLAQQMCYATYYGIAM
jgi:hypothetical protein